MANVLMPVMVVLDCGLKRQGLAHFVDKQEKHRGGWQRSAAISFTALPIENCWKSPYSAIASPEPPNSAGKSLNFGRPSRIGSTVSA
jgi:hypothetical protein